MTNRMNSVASKYDDLVLKISICYSFVEYIKMVTREDAQTVQSIVKLWALPCGNLCASSSVTIFIYPTKLLHVPSRSMFLIPGHGIYSPQNSSYLSSNFMLIFQFFMLIYLSCRRNKVYRSGTLY